MANKLAQLQQLRAVAVRTQGAIAAVAKAASDAITQVADSKADKDHTHTLPTASSTVLGVVKIGEGIESSSGVISSVFRSRGKLSNLNDATAPGWYAYAAGTANAPTGGAGIVQVVSVEGTVWPIQIAFPTAGTVIFIRTYDGTVWSAWTSVNSWRGVQNSLTSDSTTDSLSAAMGKALKALVDGKAASSHTHSKSEVGLGNVDNTADASKSVKYATSAGSAGSAGVAAQLGRGGDVSAPMTFKWEGQTGQPNFLFGSNDGATFKAYSPSNFHVAYADSAGTASGFSGLPYTITFEGCYAGTGTGGTAADPIVISLSNKYDAVGIIPWTSFGDEACVVRNLFELVTNETRAASFSGNFIPTGMLSSDWKLLAEIQAGCGAIGGVRPGETYSDMLGVRLNGTNLEVCGSVKADGTNVAVSALNSSGMVYYYYYGLNFVPFHF